MIELNKARRRRAFALSEKMKHSNITVSSGKLQFAELIKAHFYTPFGVPCGHTLPLPLGEVAERSEDGEGKQKRLQGPLSHLR